MDEILFRFSVVYLFSVLNDFESGSRLLVFVCDIFRRFDFIEDFQRFLFNHFF